MTALNADGKHEKPAVTNNSYDVLKFIALIFLPALGSAYYASSEIWGLPAGAEVVGTVTIVDGLLGLVVKYLSTKYENSDAKFDGDLVLDPAANAMHVEVEDRQQLESLQNKTEVTFKVKRPG